MDRESKREEPVVYGELTVPLDCEESKAAMLDPS